MDATQFNLQEARIKALEEMVSKLASNYLADAAKGTGESAAAAKLDEKEVERLLNERKNAEPFKTFTMWRVRPLADTYSHEDFEKVEDAFKRANERNMIRPRDYGTNLFWKGDRCTIQKVITTVIEVTN